MTKVEIVQKVHANPDVPLTMREAIEAVQAVFNVMTHELSKGNNVIVRGVGEWRVRKKNGRWGRNPRNGEKAWVRPRHVVQWKPSKLLKERVR